MANYGEDKYSKLGSPMKPLYKGISLVNFTKNKSIRLSDVELIKRDIINHIFTRKGERVKMSNFGTIIPDLVFEPLDENIIFTVRSEIERVLQFEPRISATAINVLPFYDLNVLVVSIQADFVELNLNDVIDILITFNE